jgi:hypothetical protein
MANEFKAIKTCAAFKLGAAVAESTENAVTQFKLLIKPGMSYPQYKIEAAQFRAGYEAKSRVTVQKDKEAAARQAWSRLMRQCGLTRDAKTGVSVDTPKAASPRNSGKKGKKGAAPTKGNTGATMVPEMDKLFGAAVAEYIKTHATIQGEIIRLVESRIATDTAQRVARGKRAS